MSGLATASKDNLTRLAERMAAHWPVWNVLGRPLCDSTDAELDRALAAAGRSRADLFAVTPGNAPHRQRMAQLIAHFGIAPHFAAGHFWDTLRAADGVCLRCGNRRRCKSWLEWPVSNDAPRVFCPNAKTFDAIAFCQKML